MTWIVKMNTKTKRIALLVAGGCFLFSTIGCTTTRLPGFAKKEDTAAMDSYVAQAASEIQYDTDVDFDRDYQPAAEPAASYTSPPIRTASRTGGGSGGSCCN